MVFLSARKFKKKLTIKLWESRNMRMKHNNMRYKVVLLKIITEKVSGEKNLKSFSPMIYDYLKWPDILKIYGDFLWDSRIYF
jgi:hypothetical protein